MGCGGKYNPNIIYQGFFLVRKNGGGWLQIKLCIDCMQTVQGKVLEFI